MMIKHRLWTALLLLGVVMSPHLSYGQLLGWDDFEVDLGGEISVEVKDAGFEPGYGWSQSWGCNGVTHAAISNASPLLYAGGLKSTAQYLVVPVQYGSANRQLDVSNIGVFSDYLVGGSGDIGKEGTTLWYSLMARATDVNNMKIMLSQHQVDQHVVIAPSTSGNWALTGAALSSEVESSISIVQDEVVLLVLKLEFTASATNLDLYINPTELGGAAPATPDVSTTTDYAIAFDKQEFSQGDFDEIRFGASYADVTPIPKCAIDAIGDQAPVFDNEGQQSIDLKGITEGKGNTTAISVTAVSNNQSVMPNSNLTVDYTSPNETGTLYYSPVMGEVGTVTITLTVSAPDVPDVVEEFTITIQNSSLNNPPTIDPPPDVVLTTLDIGNAQSINLTGISDGDPASVQVISVTAGSEHSSVVNNISIDYTSDNSSGVLHYTPLAIGQAEIVLTLKDDGGTADGGNDTKCDTFVVDVLELGNIGLIENFNDNAKTGWTGGGVFNLTEDNQELLISGKKLQIWDGIDYNFDPIDVRDYPRLSIKVKSPDRDINLCVAAMDEKGDGSGIETFYVQSIDLGIGSSMASQEVIRSDRYQTFSFDLRTIPDTVLEELHSIEFMINSWATSYEMDVYFEDIKIGVAAESTPSMTATHDKTFMVAESGTKAKTFKLFGITDGLDDTGPVNISATSSNPSLLPDPVIDYLAYQRTAKITLQPNDNQTGKATVSVIVSSPNVPHNKVMTFEVLVSENIAPDFDEIVDRDAEKGVQETLKITGIFDGNPAVVQAMSVTAVSSDDNKLTIDKVDYDPFSQTALLTYSPQAAASNGDVVDVEVTVTDDGHLLHGGDCDKSQSFSITIYDALNHPPVFAELTDMTISDGEAGIHHISITGIEDGDDGTQSLTLAAISSADNIISILSVTPVSPEGTATLWFESFTEVGSAIIDLTLSDLAGTANNNGNQVVTHSFAVEVVVIPISGYKNEFDGSNGTILSVGGTTVKTTMDATEENDNLHVDLVKIPNNWPSMTLNILAETGKELDLTKTPVINIRMKSAATNFNSHDDRTLMGIYLVDNRGLSENPKSWQASLHEFFNPEDDSYHLHVIDFSDGPFAKEDVPIDMTRIQSIMITFDQYWNDDVDAEYWIDYIAIGDSAYIAPEVTLDDVPNQVLLPKQAPKPVKLTGISDGEGNPEADLSVLVGNPALVTNVNTSPVADGQSTLIYTLADGVKDTATITIIADNPNKTDDIKDTVRFIIAVVDTAAVERETVTIDMNDTHQTMVGIGPHMPGVSPDVAIDLYNEMNFTLTRIFGQYDYVETENDNGDPEVLELEGFDIDDKQMELLQRLNEETNCQNWHYTPLTQAYWLKYNKRPYTVDPWFKWTTNNRLNPDYYDELAEWYAGMIKAIKAESGVELYGMSLSNEPQFDEPYGSTEILHSEFSEIVKNMGQRFDKEGITTKIVAPDNPANFDWVTGPVNDIDKDPEAAPYLGIIAIHGSYSDDDASDETPLTNSTITTIKGLVEDTHAQEAFHTEGHAYSDTWEGEYIVDWNGSYHFTRGVFESTVSQLYLVFSEGNFTGYEELGLGGMFKEGRKDFKNRMAIFKQYTYYILPGDVRVTAHSTDIHLWSMAFKDADDKLKIVLANSDPSHAKVVNLAGSGFPMKFSGHLTQQHNLFQELNNVDSMVIIPPRSVVSLMSIENAVPTIDPVMDITRILSDGDTTFTLTGITDGDPDFEQNLDLSVSSEYEEVATVTWNYTPNEETASLTVSPISIGKSLISITLSDDGNTDGSPTSKTISFEMTVVASLNQLPTIDPIDDVAINEDADEYTINLSGITDGDEGGIDQGIVLSITNSNEAATGVISSTTVQPDGTAGLSFTPPADANGVANISLKVTDQGGTPDNNGNQSIIEIFTITVNPVNDQPTIKSLRQDVELAAYVERDTITLGGIEDGDPEAQAISVTASSSMPGWAQPEVIYPYEGFDNRVAIVVHFLTAEGGAADITVQVQDDGGTAFDGIDTITTTFNVSMAVGVEELYEYAVKCYPNPATDRLHVVLPQGALRLSILDLAGRTLMMQTVKNQTYTEIIKINDLAKGTYLLNVLMQDNTLYRSKFIKQ